MNQTSQIRNNEDFYFVINENSIETSSNSTIVSECGTIKLFINGEVYSHTIDSILSGFLSKGTECVKELEGSFVIFYVNGLIFHILTDKINSKKAFYERIDNTWHVATNIDLLPKHLSEISVDGLACYLANGVMYNNLTLFKDISIAERASVLSFEKENFLVRSYWNYKFSYPSIKKINEQNLMSGLEQLLINSVKLRYDPLKKSVLSLSAGYDSRGILGILFSIIKAKEINCFSYVDNENPIAEDDAILSGKLASLCGYNHQIFLSYNGDLISHLKDNATTGKCLANYCDELGAWNSLSQQGRISDIFAGDECFGWSDVSLKTKVDILSSVGVNNSRSIIWMKQFLRKTFYKELCESISGLNDKIFLKTSALQEFHDKKDFLYLDQRINHVLMPWREIISHKLGCFVHNPYLDGSILDFITTIPPELRKNKLLFKNTITKMLPDFFRISKAKHSASGNWQHEIIKNRLQLIQLIKDSDSPLDSYISKHEVIKMINNVENIRSDKFSIFLIKIISYFRQKHSVVGKISRRLFRNNYSNVKSTKYLLRVLLIRIYLSSVKSENAN